MRIKGKLYLVLIFALIFCRAVPVYGEESAGPAMEFEDSQTTEPEGAEGFVQRMYKLVLGREYDDAGFEFWVSGLKSGELNGAIVAESFVFSQEFVDKNLSDEEYLEILYKTFFNREPDESGYVFWLDWLKKGATRRFVCSGFVDSEEFKILCETYGITPGEMQLTQPADKYPQISMFVYGCYSSILGREPDEEGLNNWVAQLSVGGASGASVAESFALSEELLIQNLSDEAYVELLYEAFLGREPDETGMESWVTFLQKGISKRFVCSGLVGSEEFKKMCENYGIYAGSVSLEMPRDLNPYATMYIYDCYKTIFKREATEDELNLWVGKINSGEMQALDVVRNFFVSQEYILMNVSAEEYIMDLHQVIYEETCGEEKLAYLVKEFKECYYDRNLFFNLYTEKIPKNAFGINSIAYVFVGDSRFVGMDVACNIEEYSDKYFSISEGATGCYWFMSEAVPQIEQLRMQHPEITSWCIISGMGVNDMNSFNYYRQEYERLKDLGYQLYLLSVNPVEDGGTIFKNIDIKSFNTKLRTITNVTYIDCFSYLMQNGFTTVDKLHYTDETYLDIFEFIRGYLAF